MTDPRTTDDHPHPSSPQLTPPPQAYLSFIDRMRRVASSHGLDWHIELDSNGAATSNTDWDLRKLNKSHDLHVPGSWALRCRAT